MKKYLFITLSLLVCVLAMAEPINSKKALEIATGYLAESGAPRRAAAQMSVQPFQTDRQGNPLMYAVNNGGDGYVIVSGDDRMRQVLVYSNSGSLDLDDMPSNMRYWLQSLCTDMQLLIDAGYQLQAVDSRRAAVDVKPEIRPMLSCKWGQGDPYNTLCPMDGDKLSLTGCVATAMAQVLYYHKMVRKAEIPSQPLQDSQAYEGERGISVPALNAADYVIDWDQLIDIYDETSSDSQKQNIAKLMYFCGAAVRMDYGSDVSLASDKDISPVLIDYFGFSKGTRLVSRSSYTEQQWAELMYNELKNGRPIIYGGAGTEGGHQFVIDGYNGNELFHINWGWDGRYDNFVALSVLNSDGNFPIGARESTAEFASDQGAVINAEYGGTAPAAQRLSFYSSRIDKNKILFDLINNTGYENSFDVCMAYKDLKTGKTDYFDNSKATFKDLKNEYYGTYSFTFTTPYPPAANNEIIVYPVSRVVGTDEWLTISDPVLQYAKVSYDAEGNVTLSLYPTENLTASISVDGNNFAGNTQKIKAAVTNTGDEKQLTIFFWVKTDPNYFDNTEEKDLKYDAYAGITALKDSTHVEVVPFTPAEEGTYYIWVTKDREGKEVLAQSQVIINANPHVVNGLAFYEFEPQGLQSTTIMDNGDIVLEVYAASVLPARFVLVNASDNNIVNARLKFRLSEKKGGTWTEKSSRSYTLSLSAGNKIGINSWTSVNGIGEYRLEVLCNDDVTDTRYINTHETYIVADAYGKLTPILYTSGAIETPANATALVLENIVNKDVTVTPNANPNTLYYLGNGMTPTGLDGRNIINYDLAENIVLQDGTDFSVAYNFTAQNISYKRSFQAGWTTLMLPFDITEIPEGLIAMEFVSEDDGEVSFKQVSKMSAFEACLVKVDAAKEITFKATNQKLWSNYTDAATAHNVKFVGITSKPDYAKAYMLNEDGTKFVLSDNPKYQSFRGCFVPTYGATNLPAELTVVGDPTGIKNIQVSGAKTDDGYYNLAGQRVGADFKGIVIHNGKKMLKK
jgi:hypothetical protein